MVKKLLYLLIIFWSVSAWGQVIVPSLDPAKPVELASAVAWRIGSTIAQESEVYYQEKDATNDAATEHVRSSVLLVYQPGNLIGELYYSPIAKTTNLLEADSSSVEWKDTGGTGLSLRFAIRGSTNVSVGLGYERFEYDDNGKNRLISLYEGSFSLRLFDGLLYTGGGMQRVSVQLDSADLLKYNKVIGGAAMQIGDPLGMIFQLEGGVKLTPETQSDAIDGITYKQAKTTESYANVEFSSGSFFLAYHYTQLAYEDLLGSDDATQTNNRYGAGLRLGGFVLGLYRKTWKVEYVEEIQEFDTYQFTLSYNFL